MCGTSAEVPWSLGCYSRGAGFRVGGFSLPSPSPLLDFCARPLVPGSARFKNPRWRSISERNGFSVMKPPVTACKQAMSACVGLTTFSKACMLHYFPSTQNLTSELRASREFVLKCTLSKWLITCHRSLISVGQLTMCGTWAEVPLSVGCYSRGAGFRAGGFCALSPPPSPRWLCSTLNLAQT